jgi:hypothetical protein
MCRPWSLKEAELMLNTKWGFLSSFERAAIWSRTEHRRFWSMAFKRCQCKVALLAHAGNGYKCNSFCHVPATHWFPPPDTQTYRNMNRRDYSIVGSLRSPPPAANRNRWAPQPSAVSVLVCCSCDKLWNSDLRLKIRFCVMVDSGLLRSRS